MKFTPTEPGTLILDTLGSEIDTVMVLYTAQTLLDLRHEECNDDVAADDLPYLMKFSDKLRTNTSSKVLANLGRTSHIRTTLERVEPGRAHLVAVDGVEGTNGIICLNYRFGKRPRITADPMDQTVCQGASITFSVTTETNSAPLCYQWQKRGIDIPDATNAVLTIKNAQAATSGRYRVLVSNFIDTVPSAEAELRVNEEPSFIVQPRSRTDPLGTTVTLSTLASGTPPPGYQWLKDGVLLPGKINPDLVLTNIQLNQQGGYSVTVSNTCGSITSKSAVLTVLERPTIVDLQAGQESEFGQGVLTVLERPTIVDQPDDVTVVEGATALFEVKTMGYQPVSYQWLSNSITILGATNPVLTLSNVMPSFAAIYSVIASNIAGATNSKPALLSVIPSTNRLSVELRGTDLVISWPKAGSEEMVLQFTERLPSTNWLTVISLLTEIEGKWTVQIPVGHGSGFYRLAKVPVTGAIQMKMTLTNNMVEIRWPKAGSEGMVLQFTDRLSPANWTFVPTEPTEIDGNWVLLLPASDASRSYRLAKLPLLKISITNGLVEIRWPKAGSDGFTLEYADRLNGLLWKSSGLPQPVDEGENKLVRIPATEATRFYRLNRP